MTGRKKLITHPQVVFVDIRDAAKKQREQIERAADTTFTRINGRHSSRETIEQPTVRVTQIGGSLNAHRHTRD